MDSKKVTGTTLNHLLHNDDYLTFELAKSSEPTIDDVRKMVIELPGRDAAILDRHLSSLYGVATKVLNQQVKRNSDWFDEDYYFELTTEECLVTKCDQRGGSHFMFNHYGCNAVSFLLRTPQALSMRKIIIKVFTEKESAGNLTIKVNDFGQIVRDALSHRLNRYKKLTPAKFLRLKHYFSVGLRNVEIAKLMEVNPSRVHDWRKSLEQLELYGNLEGTTDITLMN